MANLILADAIEKAAAGWLTDPSKIKMLEAFSKREGLPYLSMGDLLHNWRWKQRPSVGNVSTFGRDVRNSVLKNKNRMPLSDYNAQRLQLLEKHKKDILKALSFFDNKPAFGGYSTYVSKLPAARVQANKGNVKITKAPTLVYRGGGSPSLPFAGNTELPGVYATPSIDAALNYAEQNAGRYDGSHWMIAPGDIRSRATPVVHSYKLTNPMGMTYYPGDGLFSNTSSLAAKDINSKTRPSLQDIFETLIAPSTAKADKTFLVSKGRLHTLTPKAKEQLDALFSTAPGVKPGIPQEHVINAYKSNTIMPAKRDELERNAWLPADVANRSARLQQDITSASKLPSNKLKGVKKRK